MPSVRRRGPPRRARALHRLGHAARHVDELRGAHGLAPDPGGERLLGGPSVTLTPPALDGHRRERHYRERRPLLAPLPGSGAATSARWSTSPTARSPRRATPIRGSTSPRSSSSRRSTCGSCSTRGRRGPRRAGHPARRRARRALGATRPPSRAPRGRDGVPRRRRQRAHGRSPRACRSRSCRASATSPSTRAPSRHQAPDVVVPDAGALRDAVAELLWEPRYAAAASADRGRRGHAPARRRGDRGPARGAPDVRYLSLNARMRSSYCAASRA